MIEKKVTCMTLKRVLEKQYDLKKDMTGKGWKS